MSVCSGESRRGASERELRICALHDTIYCHLLPSGVGSPETEAYMQSMNISLPDPLKQFVDAQIAQGRYSSVSEYVRELIRADEKRKAAEWLDVKLMEGLSSEEAALTAADWDGIRKEAMAKIAQRKAKR